MNQIRITEVKSTKYRIEIHFECKGPINKFFEKKLFVVDYNNSIEDCPEEILVIPFVASTCPMMINGQRAVHRLQFESENQESRAASSSNWLSTLKGPQEKQDCEAIRTKLNWHCT